MEASSPDPNHNPRVLGSWARRTGFKSNLSGESGSVTSDTETRNTEMSSTKANAPPVVIEKSPAPEVASSVRRRENGRTRAGVHVPSKFTETTTATAPVASANSKPGFLPRHPSPSPAPIPTPAPAAATSAPPPPPPPPPPGRALGGFSDPDGMHSGSGQIRIEPIKGYKDPELDVMSQSQDAEDVLMAKQSHMKYEIRESPGCLPLALYGMQHYFSIIGSLVLIPLVIVPAMGGNDKDTAYVVSTAFLVSGISTLLHSFFGTRLPLIQGSSFVYLAPALAIINLSDFSSISTNRFKATMRELQGAIIVGSLFQMVLGYSGLMAILVRFINPVVVAPTVAAVGLSFFTYGFPIVGTCVEIGIPQVLLIVLFALYLRKVSIFGHRIFQVYAVPLGLAITWAYAFLLTATGSYNYHECNFDVPSSNILSESCRRHAYTMQHCRTDTSNAMKVAAWIRFPYPFQWGMPTFHFKTAVVMIVVTIISSVDSVGSYHASSLLVASRAPTPGVVSRGIGMEGVTSALAGLWGIGTGATTLTENVHTIAVTKMGSRRAVEVGACILILMSVIGKIGAFIASIPQVIVAGLLCVMWAMIAALGLSNLRYSETGSSRNVLIVGLSLFLSLSVPAYFQEYGVSANSVATVPSTLQPYIVASHGPIRTTFIGLNFTLNTLLSMNMVVSFVVAFILDNTVPGSRQERGVYVWLRSKNARNEPAVLKDYGLPFGLGRLFRWVKWVGL